MGLTNLITLTVFALFCFLSALVMIVRLALRVPPRKSAVIPESELRKMREDGSKKDTLLLNSYREIKRLNAELENMKSELENSKLEARVSGEEARHAQAKLQEFMAEARKKQEEENKDFDNGNIRLQGRFQNIQDDPIQ
ncbi:MAG: hypothetical protein JW994_03225 [Candidatus Omnitrophica bacterium]|nr:hypothetical protein [Candidatus Omnitrophota bacterium]